MRKPDVIINGKYLQRWFNIYLHKITGPDDVILHDHPWWSLSFLLKGELNEHTFNKTRIIPRFLPIIRSAKMAHRLELIQGPAWTIFITGPRIRKWGFHYPTRGWVAWDRDALIKERKSRLYRVMTDRLPDDR
jgi:hypothetical protein